MRMPARLMLVDQPVFWPRFGNASLLDPLRPFLASSQYRPMLLNAPGSDRENVGARQTVEDAFIVRPGSYLLMLTGNSSAPPNDFQFEIRDAGTKRSISSQMCRLATSAGNPHNTPYARSLQFIVPGPMVVSPAGTLTVRITNLAAAANNISLLLHFAEPIG